MISSKQWGCGAIITSWWFHRNSEAVGPLWWVDDFIETVKLWGHYGESMISSKLWGFWAIMVSQWFQGNSEAVRSIMVSQWFHRNYDAVGPLWWVYDFIETVKMWGDHDDSLIIALKFQWFIKSFYNFRLNTKLSQKMFLMIYFGVRIQPFCCFKGVVSSHSPQNIVTKLVCPIAEHTVMFPGESQKVILPIILLVFCV